MARDARTAAAPPQTVEGPAADLKAHVEAMAAVVRGAAAKLPAGWHWHGQYDLLARAGRFLDVRPRPRGVRRGVPNYCYANCHWLARASARWLYAEGLAMTAALPFPFWHAVAVDATTGTAHEVTLARDNHPTAFLGLVFTRAASTAHYEARLRERGDGAVICMIDDWQQRWPLLKLDAAALAALTVDPTALPGDST